MKAKKIRKISFVLLLLFTVFFLFSEISIYRNLKRYGYGMNELPETTLVYFHISKGFTVENDNQNSVFIGRHSYIYEDVFDNKGYYEADRMGLDGFYQKKDEENNNHVFDFCITSTRDWCHWFRVYRLSDGYTIEDF